jgi:hypothetical protein
MTILELAQVLAHHIQDVKIEFINKKPVIVITRTYNEDSNKYAIAFSKICCREGDMLFCFDEDEDRTVIGEYLGYDIWFNGFYGSEM